MGSFSLNCPTLFLRLSSLHTSMIIRDPNTNRWLNSTVFNEEGRRFTAFNYYTQEIKGSFSYREYWDEQLRRCIEGYQVQDQRITNLHYFYLNFTQIKLVIADSSSKIAKKIIKTPDFWDGDYDYYWVLEIAKNGVLNPHSQASTPEEKKIAISLSPDGRRELAMKIIDRLKLRIKFHPDYLEGGYHIIIGKARRKGFSYKNASICTNTYNTIRNSTTIIGAFDRGYLYPSGTMAMASDQLSFLNENTAWGKAREFTDLKDHKKASFRKSINGVAIEAGYQSEIIAKTFKDNPEAARGKDPLFVLFEEAGIFPNLRASYDATIPGLTAGDYITGQIIIFGTGGDMEKSTVDFADMFYHPLGYGLFPVYNIWDEGAEGSLCGYFHPDCLNMEGYYDDQGNSNIEAATKRELEKREEIRKNASSTMTLQQRVQEHPLNPSEAFLIVSNNDFPIMEIREQYHKVMVNKLHLTHGQPSYLIPENDEEYKARFELIKDPTSNSYIRVAARRRVKIIPDLNNEVDPIWEYRPTNNSLKGGVVIYYPPDPDSPQGLYKIGFDPYRQQGSTQSIPSLAAIYVYKATRIGSPIRNQLVAQYIGRPYDPDDVNRIAELLAEAYNAEIMYENEVTQVKDYFKRINKLHLLAAQPNSVISSHINDSRVSRVYGMHMVEKLKDAGEKYIKKWLLEERDYDENNNAILNLHTINDPALLEELILYNRKGNFDRVMGFMMVMFQLAEDDANTQYSTSTNYTMDEDLEKLMKTQFTNYSQEYQ